MKGCPTAVFFRLVIRWLSFRMMFLLWIKALDWASWCGPCRAETPILAEVYNQYKDKGFQVLGVATWDQPKDTKKAIEDLKITWPQILNAQNTPSELYGFNGIPHIILFGPDGTIVARDLRGDALKAKVKEMMQ